MFTGSLNELKKRYDARNRVNKMIVVVGGPSGCGKSTVGSALASALHAPYVEGDALHPKANILKMESGHPLTDEDRWGWLTKVAEHAEEQALKSPSGVAVVSCSSLKKIYRDHIRKSAPKETVAFVFIVVDRDALIGRVAHRQHHFMKANMVDSQLAIMEVPQVGEKGCLVYHNDVNIADCAAKLKKLH